MERRAVVLRRDVRAGCFKEVPFDCRAVSQPNNSRAWRADNFLTFPTASSTALMQDTLARKLVWSKPVLCSALLAGACRALPPTLTATAERRPPARLVEVCFTIAPCWKPALRGRCTERFIEFFGQGKNWRGFCNFVSEFFIDAEGGADKLQVRFYKTLSFRNGLIKIWQSK